MLSVDYESVRKAEASLVAEAFCRTAFTNLRTSVKDIAPAGTAMEPALGPSSFISLAAASG